jgi:hypothetical protein
MNELPASNFNMRHSVSPVHKSASARQARGEYTQHLMSAYGSCFWICTGGVRDQRGAECTEGDTVVR